MAGGKLTPRQKMINLMYLVFIAMLALQMSKEVLSAFGLMSEKFDEVNSGAKDTNEQLLAVIASKAAENTEFKYALDEASEVKEISNEFYSYIETLKGDITKEIKIDEKSGKLPYESMDKSNIDEIWFKGDGYSKKGEEIVGKYNNYLSKMKEVLGNNVKLTPVVSEISKKFDTKNVKNREGVSIKFLDYHYKGFPAIASLAKLSLTQNDIKKAEADVYNILLGKAAIETMSLKKFQAIVVLDKNAYFQGEKVTGKVVIGKYDENIKVHRLNFAGGTVENGQAILNLTAGNIGEQSIKGSFEFIEDGKVVPLPFEGKYVVVPKPNSATIAADKMNVVYRGVDNPMTISFAGVPDNAVSASASGMSKAAGNGKYIIRPTTGSELPITVTGKLSDGSTVSDRKTYRIKDIPGPTGTIGGDMGVVKGPISRLENSQIGALIPGFDFDVNLNVKGFNLKVSGQPTVVVQGNRLNAQAKSVLKKVQRGDQVTISEIKTELVGSSIFLPRTSIVIFEVN